MLGAQAFIQIHFCQNRRDRFEDGVSRLSGGRDQRALPRAFFALHRFDSGMSAGVSEQSSIRTQPHFNQAL
jgi:hypothetical protein